MEKAIAVAALIGGLLLAGCGDAKKPGIPKVLKAQKFQLTDGKGKVYAALEFRADDKGPTMPALAFKDGKGRDRMIIRINSNGTAAILFANGDGGISMALTSLATGRPKMTFTNPKGKTRFSVSLLPNDTVALALWDMKGNPKLGLYVDKNGKQRIDVPKK